MKESSENRICRGGKNANGTERGRRFKRKVNRWEKRRGLVTD